MGWVGVRVRVRVSTAQLAEHLRCAHVLRHVHLVGGRARAVARGRGRSVPGTLGE